MRLSFLGPSPSPGRIGAVSGLSCRGHPWDGLTKQGDVFGSLVISGKLVMLRLSSESIFLEVGLEDWKE